MRSRALCRGKISSRYVPGRQSVAIISLHVSQKGPRTGKSPLPGKIRTPCIRNELALAGYARHASEKPRKPPLEDTPREYLARKEPFSLHGSLESCIVSRSCHPPRRRTAPAPATLPPSNRPSGRSPLRCRTARAIATTAPPLWRGSLPRGGRTGRGRLLVERGDVAKGVRGVVGCRALAAKLASVKLRLQVSDADNLAES